MKKYFIYLIILLAFFIRLHHVNAPIIGVHAWKQTTVGEVARNFYQNGYNLFYPEIDFKGDNDGYVEAEFQIYPFMIAIFYKIFGVQNFVGRFLSIIFSLITIYFLYLLTKKHINEKVALWTALIYSILPLNIYYGRSLLPEPTLLMASVVGIYFFSKWMDTDKWKHFSLSVFFITIACLIKPPTLYLGLPLFYLAWLKYKKNIFSQPLLWFYAALVLTSGIAWYYYAHQMFLEVGTGLSFMDWDPRSSSGRWGKISMLLDPYYYYMVFFKYIFLKHLLVVGSILFIIGFFIKRKTEEEKLFDFWLFSFIIFFILVIRGNIYHEYYQLPLMLPISVFIGKTCAKYFNYSLFKNSVKKEKIIIGLIWFLVIIIPFLSAYLYYDYAKQEDKNSPILRLAQDIQNNIEQDELVIFIEFHGDTTINYLANRKGWMVSAENLTMELIEEMGVKYIAGEKRHFKPDQNHKLDYWLDFSEIIVSNDDYFIIRVKPDAEGMIE